jgi:hypothetical protein
MPVRALLTLAAVGLAVACAGCFCIPWPRCTPMTCTEARSNCGEVPDGCGGVLDCGMCRAPETCGGFGTPNVCGCTPMSCAERGADCGVIDNCGEPLDCGTCTGPWTCGGGVGGRPNVCGCTLTTCEDEGANCGTTLNDCAEPISCGTCTAPQTCGGSGTPNVCGCTPTTCFASGATCGVISDGCGGTLDCGPCPPRCGNDRLEAGEQCDDGNTADGDLCSASCLLEAACPPVPDAPTTGLEPGTSRGSVSVELAPRTIDWSSAAFVPIRGTTQFQLIVSNDPRLCDTLVNTNQYGADRPARDLQRQVRRLRDRAVPRHPVRGRSAHQPLRWCVPHACVLTGAPPVDDELPMWVLALVPAGPPPGAVQGEELLQEGAQLLATEEPRSRHMRQIGRDVLR